MIDLTSKKILVVGGSSGMGLAVSKQLAGHKAALTIAARSKDKLDAAAKEIGGGVAAKVLDARDDAQVEAFFNDGTVWDHIVVTVGQGGRGPLPSMSMADALTAMDAKFWCYFRIGRAAKIAPGGSLTYVSGGEGHRGAVGLETIEGAGPCRLQGNDTGHQVEERNERKERASEHIPPNVFEPSSHQPSPHAKSIRPLIDATRHFSVAL